MDDRRSPVPEAPLDAVPALLVEPPWTGRAGREPLVRTGLKRPAGPTTVAWPEGVREAWHDRPEGNRFWVRHPDDADWAAIAAGLRDGDVPREDRQESLLGLLLRGPNEVGRAVLADPPDLGDYTGYRTGGALQGIVARYGADAYPFVLGVARQRRADLEALGPFIDQTVAQLMINGLGDRVQRDDAKRWFRWHGPAAAPFVIPDALRKPGPKRDLAERALRLIADEHGSDVLAEAARHYDGDVVAAMEAFRTEPLDLYPDPLPDLPANWKPEQLPAVLLAGGEAALPAAAFGTLLMMLVISTPERPYAGAEEVARELDPGSLAELAWALFTHEHTNVDVVRTTVWASPGTAYALRRFGDDRTAVRLADTLVRWPKKKVWDLNATGLSASGNAVEVIRDIGTVAALRQLDRLARTAADRDRIRKQATGMLAGIARRRGLSPEQLADLLVSDLGLDTDGAMTLDYGPRTFRVGFDELLVPYVLDQDGKRRKTLPKPGVKDDQDLAPAAHERFKALKKEARTVTADQTKRLESAMVTGRSWTPDEFRSVFLDHPLLRHIVRRLVWRAGDTTFRVAEDGTLAGSADEAFTLPEGAQVTLPHPLRMADVDAWTEVFADYEIGQPFPQLARTVHTLTDPERTASRLTRFEGGRIPAGAVLGLPRAGWVAGEAEYGHLSQVSLELATGRHAVVTLDPGVFTHGQPDDADTKITGVVLSQGPYGPETGTFGELDPVRVSELLATLTRLTGRDAS